MNSKLSQEVCVKDAKGLWTHDVFRHAWRSNRKTPIIFDNPYFQSKWMHWCTGILVCDQINWCLFVTWEDREKMSTESVRLAWPWRQWLGEGTSSQLWFFLWQLLFSRIIRSHTLCCNEFRISLGEIPLLLLFQAQSVHKGVYRHAAACRIFVVKTLKHLCAFVYWTSNYFYKYCLEDETANYEVLGFWPGGSFSCLP
jgi:hypothetical protein